MELNWNRNVFFLFGFLFEEFRGFSRYVISIFIWVLGISCLLYLATRMRTYVWSISLFRELLCSMRVCVCVFVRESPFKRSKRCSFNCILLSWAKDQRRKNTHRTRTISIEIGTQTDQRDQRDQEKRIYIMTTAIYLFKLFVRHHFRLYRFTHTRIHVQRILLLMWKTRS